MITAKEARAMTGNADEWLLSKIQDEIVAGCKRGANSIITPSISGPVKDILEADGFVVGDWFDHDEHGTHRRFTISWQFNATE